MKTSSTRKIIPDVVTPRGGSITGKLVNWAGSPRTMLNTRDAYLPHLKLDQIIAVLYPIAIIFHINR
ncbi:hypothetical protein PGT21_031216 [Puccinia graminis f. sp. tritici]|uniref:Uncharacterized protein n=1 Tax=Puccinia graminis f. sp. tritici TaxID=56615 RepID=A0A5B0PVF3_PUCGR|nr:hypothetical protein PGTUg99_002626 [Puccinia graminis f. sp. tritici]KAA1104754.1 hypothetical protein PGT21_031216 [Puccinia graminis f. sp. tritici]